MGSLLLLLLGGGLDGSGSSDGKGGLVLLRDGDSLTVGGGSPDSVTSLSAHVSVVMVCHVGADLAVGGLHLQALDLARGIVNLEIFEDGLWSLLVLVLNLLGLGVHLLLSLTLSGVEVASGFNVSLVLEGALEDSHLLIELRSASDQTVDFVAGQFFNAL